MENTVSQMSVSELRELISDIFDEKFAEYSDPDRGLEFRDDFVEMIRLQDERIKAGEQTIPFEEVLNEFKAEHEMVVS